MRAAQSPCLCWCANTRYRHLALGGLLLTLFFTAPVQAGRQPLPPEEQELVDRAIDHGVIFLKHTQGPRGTWAANESYQAGYAALPGLTLLECGVLPTDARIQRVAGILRRAAPHLDRTYEIALTLLFFDRLGEPRDREVIQTLALRLVAGQSPSGGWGYKCPLLPRKTANELLLTLRRLDPPGERKLTVQPAKGGSSPRESSSGLPERAARPSLGPLSLGSRHWAWCIKSLEQPGPTGEPGQPEAKVQPAALKQGQAQAAEAQKPAPAGEVAAGPAVIPGRWKNLTVFQEANRLIVQDPPNRGGETLFPTTDNSNTQFAILALWAAQRHDVPLERTLQHMVKRFQLSQNSDGSWSYEYALGLSNGRGGTGAMTCVGLLGLAVGHGLAHHPDGRSRGRAGQKQDPRILNGLVALSTYVGQPAGRMQNLPMANLYFLWSVERVGVLYDLPTIGDKDWYRWGAEILVANQTRLGNWEGGGYHGATPVLDTCLALLFLKRANLLSSLGQRLPFNPGELAQAVQQKVEGSNDPSTQKKPEAAEKPPAQAEKKTPPKDALADGSVLPEQPRASFPQATVQTLAETPSEGESSGRKVWTYVFFFLGALLLLGSGIFVALYLRSDKEEQPEREPPRKAARPAPARG